MAIGTTKKVACEILNNRVPTVFLKLELGESPLLNFRTEHQKG